jgi:hypothetical protein
MRLLRQSSDRRPAAIFKKNPSHSSKIPSGRAGLLAIAATVGFDGLSDLANDAGYRRQRESFA